MISRLQGFAASEPIENRESNVASKRPRPLVNYYLNKFNEDPIPKPNLIGAAEEMKEVTKSSEIKNMSQRGLDNVLPHSHSKSTERLVWELAQNFSIQLSATSTNVESLQIMLTQNALQVRVKHRNYSPSQREFVESHERVNLEEHCILEYFFESCLLTGCCLKD